LSSRRNTQFPTNRLPQRFYAAHSRSCWMANRVAPRDNVLDSLCDLAAVAEPYRLTPVCLLMRLITRYGDNDCLTCHMIYIHDNIFPRVGCRTSVHTIFE